MVKYCTIWILALVSFAAWSQPFRFTTYSIQQGLSQSVVNCVFQDSRGFIWIGTQNGLNRFDGYDFTVYLYNPDDTTSISNNWIYSVTEDDRGDLWIGTKGGLNHYIRSGNRFRRMDYTSGYGRTISACAYDAIVARDGRIYVNTPPAVSVFDPAKGRFSYLQTGFEYDGSISDNRIPLLEDREGNIWVGTISGLSCIDPLKGRYTRFREGDPASPPLSNYHITALCQDTTGVLWVGTSSGLNLLNHKSRTVSSIFTSPDGLRLLSHPFIRTIICDRNGAIWIGTEGGGLNRVTRLNREAFLVDRYNSAVNGLADDIVLALAVDRSNNLWAGTLQGVSKTDLKPARFRLYRRDNSSSSVDLLGNVIASIYKDSSGRVWAGNWGQGLNILDRRSGKVEHYSSRLNGNNYIPNDFIHVIFPDEMQRVWIGSRDGIHVFDHEKGRFVNWRDFFRNYHLPDLRGMRIYDIIRGRDNSLWIGTQAGLYRLLPDRKAYELFTSESALNHRVGANMIYCIREDHLGMIWIATINGLNVYNPATRKMTLFRNNGKRNSLCDNFVISLCEDSEGNMWIGTGAYVNKFIRKDSAFIYYSKDHGLPANNIFEILRDDRNTLWFATGGGLCRFDTATESFRTYSQEDGLQSNEFNLRACFRSPDGEVFFGGMNGFNSFYPSTVRDNPHLPDIVVTGCYKISRFGRSPMEISPGGTVILEPGDKDFTIEFVALEFTNPVKNQYAYMLEGMSDEWINIGNRRFVPFSNLPPGEYQFHVKGSNNDGIWNEKGTSLTIVVLPPWWRTWWAWTGYILLAAGALIIFIRLREQNLVRERNLLETRVHERTRQIETKNMEIVQKNAELNQLNEELQALNQTKDKFFSIIAHDLRNPFNSIIGLSDIVAGNLRDSGQEKSLKMVSDIREASRHAFDLLQNLLIWARSQTGNLEFQPAPFDLTERIHDNLDLVKGQAARKNISLHFDNQEPMEIHADGQMVNTILRNLLTNAIKFTPRDGRVEVRTFTHGDGTCIEVCDNGIGITPEIREKIFRIESKYTRKGTEKERGTGLGLILCKEFAERHGGRIMVDSEPGRGSCFRVCLPQPGGHLGVPGKQSRPGYH